MNKLEELEKQVELYEKNIESQQQLLETLKRELKQLKVEKKKLYTVRLANGDCLCRFKSVGIDWAKGQDYRNDKDFHLTQAEIESVDPRLMDFAEVVEK